MGRVRRLASRPGAWIEDCAGGYPIWTTPDRRGAPRIVLDEVELHALIDSPGLSPVAGGWRLRRATAQSAAPEAGRPGIVLCERIVMRSDGRAERLPANQGQSAIAWLASRRDVRGQPFLRPAQVAAAERLRQDAEIAAAGPSLTMRWDALPRARGGSAARVQPGDRALAAGARVDRALDACAPGVRAIVRHICIHETALTAAERDLGLRRREGKRLLRVGLDQLARHYRLE